MKLLFLLFAIISLASVEALGSDDEAYFNEHKASLMSFGEGVVSGFEIFTSTSICGSYKSPHSSDLPLLCQSKSGIQVVKIDKGDDHLLYKLIITKENFNTPYGKLSSIDTQSIKSYFGEPYKKYNNKLDYSIPSYSSPHTIIFTMNKNKVSEIEWRWSID